MRTKLPKLNEDDTASSSSITITEAEMYVVLVFKITKAMKLIGSNVLTKVATQILYK